MTERLLVIGADAAGMTAASQARRLKGPDELEILAFDRGNYTSFSACGIPYFVGGEVASFEDLVVRTPEQFRDKQDIEVRLRHEVTAIDLAARQVTVTNLDDGVSSVEAFDTLMIGTGASPVRPDLPGGDAEGIYGVQVLDDGVALRHLVEERKPTCAVVIGGGYIGLEMAEALIRRGLSVSLVERGAQPMKTLDPDMGALVADALEAEGVKVYRGESVYAFDTVDGHVSAVKTSERTIPADLVVLGLGVRPNVGLARDAGIAVGASGGISVDRQMRTSAEGVWAAGDCVESFHLVSRRWMPIALGTHANKQGRVAGINIGGGYATFPGVVGTAVSKLCRVEVARTGLGEMEAVAAGFATVVTTVDSTTRAGYFPGAQPIRTKIIAERRSGRLLGGQIVGREGAAKRIDVLATAIWNRMTVEEMQHLDLSYAPPFAPVWDPVLIAVRKAAELVQSTP